jgi:hypothetical protein
MTSAQTVARGQDWWMGREARISQKLQACSPAVIPHRAPALPRDAPPKNREKPRNREVRCVRGVGRAMFRSSQHLQGLDRHDPSGPGPGSGGAVLHGPIRLTALCGTDNFGLGFWDWFTLVFPALYSQFDLTDKGPSEAYLPYLGLSDAPRTA